MEKQEKQLKGIKSEIENIKKLLILLLKHFKVNGRAIATTLGVSEGRLSQVASKKKYKKKNKK